MDMVSSRNIGGLTFDKFLDLSLFCNNVLTGETLPSAEILFSYKGNFVLQRIYKTQSSDEAVLIFCFLCVILRKRHILI